jgi:hypothetical protein
VPHEAATVGLGEQFAYVVVLHAERYEVHTKHDQEIIADSEILSAPMPLPAFSLYTELNFDGYAEQDDLVWQNSLIEGIL